MRMIDSMHLRMTAVAAAAAARARTRDAVPQVIVFPLGEGPRQE